MTSAEKLDQIIKPLTDLKEPSIGDFMKATTKALKTLEDFLKVEYEKGYQKGKQDKKIIDNN